MAQRPVCCGDEGLGCPKSALYVPLLMNNWESKSLNEFSPDAGAYNLIVMKGALGTSHGHRYTGYHLHPPERVPCVA